MSGIRKILTMLLVLIVSGFGAGGPGMVPATPQMTQQVSPVFVKEAEENKSTKKARDGGGTPAYSIKVTASQEFRSDKEEPDTTQPVYDGLHVIFGGTEAIRQGGGAPVVTAAKGSAFAVEMKPSQVGAEHHDTKFDADSETMNTQTLDVAARDPAYA